MNVLLRLTEEATTAPGASAGKRMSPRVQSVTMIVGNLLILGLAAVIILP